MSSLLYLFLTHLAVGIIVTLLVVAREAGVKFFRFNAGLALILLVSGLAFRPVAARPPSVAAMTAVPALAASACALLVYWATVGRLLAPWRRPLLWIAAATGLVGVVAQALAVSSSFAFSVAGLTVASFLSSAALLGGACTAMILGHWYLVLPSLDVAHLQSMVKFHLGSMIVRVAVVGAVVFMAIATWEPGTGPRLDRYVLSTSGVFFWQRVLFGLAGPGVLSYLTWETAKIRSTQSATGILYVDFFTVIVGEVLAKYLLLTMHVPV